MEFSKNRPSFTWDIFERKYLSRHSIDSIKMNYTIDVHQTWHISNNGGVPYGI